MENKFQLKPSDRDSIDFAEAERKRVDGEGSVVHSNGESYVEHVDVVYDMTSADVEKNWGYTAGFGTTEGKITGKDFSKYRYLRVYFDNNWLSGYCIIDLRKTNRLLTEHTGSSATTAYDGKTIYFGGICVSVRDNKTSILVEYLHYAGSHPTSAYSFINKIEGVY